MKKAAIFCSGEMDDDSVWPAAEREQFLVICADGGLRHARRLGITPDVVIGDCDSSKEPYPSSVAQFVYPPEKDATDTNLCLDYALSLGCTQIWLFGGIGGRLDHEFSHFCLLLYALRRGAEVKMVNGQNEIWMIDHSFFLERTEKKYVSFFPYGGPVEDFCIRGLKYEADHMYLDCGKVQASCNEFAQEDIAQISFREGGILLVMLSKDKT
ncbi:thiamine diphosphokinase [Ructibacterium gallinarum]|uniref:Thiamine diphosphokinase n=1 Tax=Ructibacterium gallinarum TaxID=2779355 RepID=A0A9D5M4Z3_9FIRM|nr:thiamine diphosphokinase [Ructibacterium gallinarum]MBE5039542.1 thiamine diphosphokinase [Ructibacterium gallinarum]